MFFNTIMKIKTSTKTIIVALMLGCASGLSVRADDASTIWTANCAACHGKDGKGKTMMGRKLGIKDLTDAAVQSSFTDADATKAVKEGVTDKGVEKMKAFGDKLSDDDIKALVAQVRTFKPAQ
jgi:mono/diheme cytochrome c family protein